MSEEAIAAIAISVVCLVLLIGIIVFLILVWLKYYEHHSRLNALEEHIEKLEKIVNNTKTNTLTEIDETVIRRKKDPDSAIDVSDVDDQSKPGSRHMRSIRPGLTVQIRRETANIYGHVIADPQVVAIAQNYYKQKTNSSDLVGIDDMAITSVEKGNDFGTSDKHATIYEGRPTSLLLDPTNTPVSKIVNEEGVFVHKMITGSGGKLEILGVKLEIPDGALTQNTQITLGITWDSAVYPQLDKSRALLSHVIVCQPKVVFVKPVRLTFPHCAVNHTTDWNLTILHRENNLHETNDDTEWKEMKTNDVCKYEIFEHNVVLDLEHFTLYALTGIKNEGKQAAKSVRLLAFTSPFQMNKMFTVRIYCINDYNDDSAEMKTIMQQSKKLNEKQADAPQPLLLYDNGEDITVNLHKVTDGWELDGDVCQNIDFKCIWHSERPFCKFIFRPAQHYLHQIICDFSYHQQHSSKMFYLKVAEEKVQSSIALEKNLVKEQRQIQKLVLLLDPKSDNDYRILAAKLGYEYEQIRWLEEQQSPTEAILIKWTKDGKKVEDLAPVLSEMGRLDAIEDISA